MQISHYHFSTWDLLCNRTTRYTNYSNFVKKFDASRHIHTKNGDGKGCLLLCLWFLLNWLLQFCCCTSYVLKVFVVFHYLFFRIQRYQLPLPFPSPKRKPCTNIYQVAYNMYLIDIKLSCTSLHQFRASDVRHAPSTWDGIGHLITLLH